MARRFRGKEVRRMGQHHKRMRQKEREELPAMRFQIGTRHQNRRPAFSRTIQSCDVTQQYMYQSNIQCAKKLCLQKSPGGGGGGGISIYSWPTGYVVTALHIAPMTARRTRRREASPMGTVTIQPHSVCGGTSAC